MTELSGSQVVTEHGLISNVLSMCIKLKVDARPESFMVFLILRIYFNKIVHLVYSHNLSCIQLEASFSITKCTCINENVYDSSLSVNGQDYTNLKMS